VRKKEEEEDDDDLVSYTPTGAKFIVKSYSPGSAKRSTRG
jgi:hypothetical protein